MSVVRIQRPSTPLNATVRLPRSKSAANRALIIASLLGDLGLVHDPGEGDDTRILLEHLKGQGPVMHCGAGATTFRFLLAWACCREGEEHLITGTERLLERPHEDLVRALRTLGADVERVPEGYRVRGRRLQGGQVHFDSPISSQYLSALLLIAPVMERGLSMRWTGTRLSEPYVHMTLKVMAHFGVYPFMELDGVRVPPADYRPAPYTVPADWSGAAFWYEAVALSPGGSVFLQGLEDDTLQGDRQARQLFAPWVDTAFTENGALLTHRTASSPWSQDPIDLRHYPDLFQPLVCACAGRGQEARFTGLDNLRVKETDRLAAVANALGALGCRTVAEGGDFHIAGKAIPVGVPFFDPQGDHRMALALAPLALVLGTLTISDPDVVNKSYPGFWQDLKGAGFQVQGV
jgi:3-phosphoshikimate 1-carboxyvinyltransferase